MIWILNTPQIIQAYCCRTVVQVTREAEARCLHYFLGCMKCLTKSTHFQICFPKDHMLIVFSSIGPLLRSHLHLKSYNIHGGLQELRGSPVIKNDVNLNSTFFFTFCHDMSGFDCGRRSLIFFHNQPPPAFLSWYTPTLLHPGISLHFPGPGTSPSFHVQQGHPLLHMHLEPWVSPCVLSGWYFCFWDLWESVLNIMYMLTIDPKA